MTTQRLSTADARSIYLDTDLHSLAAAAHRITTRLHPGPQRTYVVDRNINYANYCTAKCIFCNFKADPPGMNSGRKDLPSGYVLTFDQIGEKIEELLAIGGTQILMQGGLVPKDLLPFAWYLDLLRFIRSQFPTIHIHAFSPPEIWGMAREFDKSIYDVICELRDAGLDSIPGGGGEILSDRLRPKIGKDKGLSQDWLEVMRQAHRAGLNTSCTMMFGHIETLDERLEHLQLLRDLQDQSLANAIPNARGQTACFTAYICWTFQPDGTPLGRVRQRTPAELANADKLARLPDGIHLQLADAYEYLRMLALSRLFLDNIPHIQSSWVTQGPKIGQLALFYGADDMGSVMMEENVVSKAGATYRLEEAQIRRLIEEAGFQPVQRDQFYQPVPQHQPEQATHAANRHHHRIALPIVQTV